MGCAAAVIVFFISWGAQFSICASAHPQGPWAGVALLLNFVPILPAVLAFGAHALVTGAADSAAEAKSRAVQAAAAQKSEAQAQVRQAKIHDLLNAGQIAQPPGSTVVVCGNGHRHLLTDLLYEGCCPSCRTRLWDFEDSHMRGLKQCRGCGYWSRSLTCPLCRR